MIRRSQGIVLVGDHIGRFEPGYLAIVGSNLPHDWVTKTDPGEVIPGRDIVLQFDPARIRRAAAELPELSKIEALLNLALRGMSFLGQARQDGAQLLETIGSTEGVERLSLFMKLLHVLAVSREFEVLSSEKFAPDLDPAAHLAIQRVLKHLVENVARDVRLSDLADMADMTVSAFSRFFRRNTGNNFVDHLTKLRVSRACDLLDGSDMSITDICFEAGYTNISNFNRSFRKLNNMTPSQYRHLAQQRITPARTAVSRNKADLSDKRLLDRSVGEAVSKKV